MRTLHMNYCIRRPKTRLRLQHAEHNLWQEQSKELDAMKGYPMECDAQKASSNRSINNETLVK